MKENKIETKSIIFNSDRHFVLETPSSSLVLPNTRFFLIDLL